MPLTPEDLLKVRAVPLFSSLRDDELDCLAGGEIITAPAGHVLANEDEKTGAFDVILEGEARIWRRYDNQSILMAVSKPGNYMGELMLLLDIPWLSTVRVAKPVRIFRLNEANFWHMMTHCQSIAREIFRAAASRMRNLEGYSQQREKLVSLGTMAAGLAHELNNPAAAARRAAAHLQETANRVQSFLCPLSHELDMDAWDHLLAASQDFSERKPPELDHLARSDRAEAIGSWLQERGVASAWDQAPTFVNSGIEVKCLSDLMEKLPAAAHVDALGWLEARLNLKSLVAQVEQSTTRISELVKAVKSYSFMDQSPMQEIDVHEGLNSTLTMLGHKLKNVTVIRAYDHTVPRIPAYGSELNQVWTNLIDNAIDAVGGMGDIGKICIGTTLEEDQIVVEIVDNGSGIPPEVQPRLFEPFFTTKGVGTGTGLGLIISNRIVADRHHGEIEFESRPGETRFKVRLPIQKS